MDWITFIENLKILFPTGATVTVVGGLLNLYRQKQWKCIKQNSSSENACFLFLEKIAFDIIIFLFVLFLTKIEFIENTSIGIACAPLFIIYSGVITIYEIRKEEVKDKFKVKEFIPDKLKSVCKKVAILASMLAADSIVIMYIWIDYDLSYWISVFCCVLFLVLMLFCLERDKDYKYQYAILYISGGNKTNKIKVKVETLFQKGKWVIATEKDGTKEYRIRARDLIRVEYTND